MRPVIFEEKSISSETVFQGRIITVKVDQVEMPDGKVSARELVNHPGGVGVVALTENREVILVKQYRKSIETSIYEIPAGKLDPGEDPRDCGIRELEEETGLIANNFEYLGFVYPSPGFTDEKTHIFLATDLKQGESHLDPDEYLDVVRMPIEEVEEKILKNEMNDAKTVVGVLHALRRLR